MVTPNMKPTVAQDAFLRNAKLYLVVNLIGWILKIIDSDFHVLPVQCVYIVHVLY